MRTRVFSKSAEGLVAVAVGAVVCAAFVPALASAAPTGAVHTLRRAVSTAGRADRADRAMASAPQPSTMKVSNSHCAFTR